MLAWDDLTHMKLDAGKVKEARAKEIEYVRNKRVYNKSTRFSRDKERLEGHRSEVVGHQQRGR